MSSIFSRPPEAGSVQWEGPLSGLGRLFNGREEVGRGPAVIDPTTGDIRVPTYSRGANGEAVFRGWNYADPGDSRDRNSGLAGLQEQSGKIRQQGLKRELKDEREEARSYQRSRDAEGDRRWEASHEAQMLGLRGTLASTLANTKLMGDRLTAEIEQNKAANDLQGKALILQAINAGNQNAIALAQLGENSAIRREEMALRKQEMGAARKSNLITAALQMMRA